MKPKTKKILKRLFIVVTILLLLANFGGAYYLFDYAFSNTGFSAKGNHHPLTKTQKWAKSKQHKIWHETSDHQGLHLKARYYEAPKLTKKTMVVVHGFGDNSVTMGSYIKMFWDAGYNVLVPDTRGHGQSEGKYIGYGWQDRDDLQKWIHQIIQKNGNDSQIGLFGLSMGASEVMFYLGLNVPPQVKVAVADCGYASIKGELSHELKEMYNLPSFPIIPTANIYAQTIAHYNFYEGETANTLKHNKVPLFIIHGTDDTFVPTKNAKINYDNDPGQKKIWLVKGAKHADSIKKEPKEYRTKVLGWLDMYFN